MNFVRYVHSRVCLGWLIVSFIMGLPAILPNLAVGEVLTGDNNDIARGLDWLHVEGETRVRYESLDGQFRAGLNGSDQLLLNRSLFLAEVRAGRLNFGIELQDSRTYLGDQGTPLSTSIVNPLDFLQAYMQVDLSGLLGPNSGSSIKLGRQTVSIGSKRQIERVSYANVIKNYTGLHATHNLQSGDKVHMIYVVPVFGRPEGREQIEDNELELDEEQWNRHIWAIHFMRKALAPALWPELSADLFVYGLNEDDASRFPTPNRQYIGPGFRLLRPRAEGHLNLDVEGVLRFGSRRASSASTDEEDLEVMASMLRTEVGYTFDVSWRPNIAFQYYWASGDDDPSDGKFDQYERLFGSRRTDLNNTSIHGPLTPANLNAPGLRFEVKPKAGTEARITYSAAFLASSTDSWLVARLRDTTGASGSFIGHVFDSRIEHWILPSRLSVEIGASALIFGDFARNVADGPEGDRTLFGYSQLKLTL